jgi:hypothetical protein
MNFLFFIHKVNLLTPNIAGTLLHTWGNYRTHRGIMRSKKPVIHPLNQPIVMMYFLAAYIFHTLQQMALSF